jgi:predicted ATPase with chaperone activity
MSESLVPNVLAPSNTDFVPPRPRSLEDTGVSSNLLRDLVLKTLYLSTSLAGFEIASKLRLDYGCIDPLITKLKEDGHIETGGQAARTPKAFEGGVAALVYTITDKGREAAKIAMDNNQYIGFAPVSLQQYNISVVKQGLPEQFATPDKLRHALKELVLPENTFRTLGPALNSRSSIFIYGNPGTGKSTIARNCRQLLGDGGIYVPYAIAVDDYIIKLFDSSYHEPMGAASPAADQRWLRTKRPFVQIGGELDLEMLDLVFHEHYKYYEAGLQMKANCGILLIDDFGRQDISPRKLLNRFIIPLEEGIDYLNMSEAGRKIEVPFGMLVFFSTNMRPSELVDEAFLRRIRYKIKIENPTKEEFKEIFIREADKLKLTRADEAADYVIKKYYEHRDLTTKEQKTQLDKEGNPREERAMRGVHPRDIILHVVELCSFEGKPVELTPKVLDYACEAYFLEHLSEDLSNHSPTI